MGNRVLTPEQFSVEVGGSVKASRKQVPLGLAWALSIHKSQGTPSLDSAAPRPFVSFFSRTFVVCVCVCVCACAAARVMALARLSAHPCWQG
jgi:hypothetical protein